jgi:hypothetical protein
MFVEVRLPSWDFSHKSRRRRDLLQLEPSLLIVVKRALQKMSEALIEGIR